MIPDEAFQNLHHLSTLNLAFNQINQLDFGAFDSVGTLSHLSIDLVTKFYLLFLLNGSLEVSKLLLLGLNLALCWILSKIFTT